MDVLKDVVLCSLCGVAVFWDLRTGRIPNRLILAGLLAALGYQVFLWGWFGAILFLGGAGLPLVVLWGLFYFRMLGAGDIKLFAVVGGFLGAGDGLSCMAAAFVLGGVIALGLMLKRKNLKERLLYFFLYMGEYLNTGNWRPYQSGRQEGREMHFSVPILLSVFIYMGGFY